MAPAHIGFELLDATAAADGWRLTDPAPGFFVKKTEGGGVDVQVIGHSGCEQAFGLHKDSVFGEKVQTLQQTVQGERRFARATVAEQQNAPTLPADTGAMQRNQAQSARRQDEDGELDQFIANVIGPAQHVVRSHHQGALLCGSQDCVVRLVHDAAQQACTRLHPHRRRFGGTRSCLAWQKAQLDAKLWRRCWQLVLRQTSVRGLDQIQ